MRLARALAAEDLNIVIYYSPGVVVLCGGSGGALLSLSIIESTIL